MSKSQHGPKKSGAQSGERRREKKHEDEALDEALEESFPASDPPAPASSSTGPKIDADGLKKDAADGSGLEGEGRKTYKGK